MTTSELNKWGYRLHCSYTTYDNKVLNCYVKFDLGVNRYAYELDGQVLVSNIHGKAAANVYFVKNLMAIVNLDTKVICPRNHLYAIHYHIGDRHQDMVMLRNGESLEEVKSAWMRHYEYAIANHNYSLTGIKEIY